MFHHFYSLFILFSRKIIDYLYQKDVFTKITVVDEMGVDEVGVD